MRSPRRFAACGSARPERRASADSDGSQLEETFDDGDDFVGDEPRHVDEGSNIRAAIDLRENECGSMIERQRRELEGDFVGMCVGKSSRRQTRYAALLALVRHGLGALTGPRTQRRSIFGIDRHEANARPRISVTFHSGGRRQLLRAQAVASVIAMMTVVTFAKMPAGPVKLSGLARARIPVESPLSSSRCVFQSSRPVAPSKMARSPSAHPTITSSAPFPSTSARTGAARSEETREASQSVPPDRTSEFRRARSIAPSSLRRRAMAAVLTAHRHNLRARQRRKGRTTRSEI